MFNVRDVRFAMCIQRNVNYYRGLCRSQNVHSPTLSYTPHMCAFHCFTAECHAGPWCPWMSRCILRANVPCVCVFVRENSVKAINPYALSHLGRCAANPPKTVFMCVVAMAPTCPCVFAGRRVRRRRCEQEQRTPMSTAIV